jgi:hypothetical protein
LDLILLAGEYRVLGFDQATGGDEVFRQLVLARIIELVSVQQSCCHDHWWTHAIQPA